MVAGIPGASSLVAWNSFIKDPASALEQFRRSPAIQTQIDEFRESFSSFESVEELVGDFRAMEVVLSAFQLEEEINFVARNQKIIEEPTQGEEAEDSLINRLIDPRYRELAEAFDFQTRGNGVFASTVVQNTIIDRFVINEFEKSLGETNPGLREAAFFSRSVGGFDNTFQLLSNQALRSVIDTGLGLPREFAQADLDQQVRYIEGRIDVDDFFEEDVDSTIRRQLDDANENTSRLSPLTGATGAAISAVQSIIDQINQIQIRISEIDQQTNPATATPAQAAEIAFQNAELANNLSTSNLLSKAASATESVSNIIGQLRQLTFDTNGLNPVADAALIADNKAAYDTLVNNALDLLNSATANNIGTGVPESLLQPIPGPGATNKTYQFTSGSAVVNVTGVDLTGFINSLNNANAQFQADNFVGADTLILGSRQDLYNARLSFSDQLATYENNLSNVDNFAASIDQATFEPGYNAVLTSQQNATNAFNLISELASIADQLSSTTLTALERTNLETAYVARQGDLDAILNPPSADNLLTTNANITVTINGGLNFETTNGIDFNGAGYPELDPGLPAPSQATAAATATTLQGYLQDVQDLRTDLIADRQQLQQIRDQFDPFGEIVVELQSLTDQLADIREGARTDFGKVDDDDPLGVNFLDQNAADSRVQLVDGTSFITRGIEDFTGQVEDVINNANATILNDRVAGNGLLTTALANLTNMRLQLQADIRPQEQALDRFAQTIADNTDPEEAQAGEFTNPYAEANDFTLQFIQRYLALSDQNNQAQNPDPILQLLNPAGGGGQDQQGGGAGIVNLLV